MESYVLIHTRAGAAGSVVRRVREIAQVIEADAVTGPFDVVARARCTSLHDLQEDLVDRIDRIDGVIRTLTCPVGTHDRLWEERLEPGYLAVYAGR